MKELTIQEAAALWGVSTRRIQQMCKDGKIAGARKEGRTWLIPDQAPVQVRTKLVGKPNKLPLPVDISGYVEAVTRYSNHELARIRAKEME